jgi:hypothetical protein
MGIWHWLLSITGISGRSTYASNFWGGFGSDLGELAVLGLLWRKVNCHAKGCYRVGLHHVDGTPYITCKKHHPVHPGSAAATAEDIARAHHRSHVARATEAAVTTAVGVAVAESDGDFVIDTERPTSDPD